MVEEYAEYDRNYLLYRIEELEEDQSALSLELSAAHGQLLRIADMTRAMHDTAIHNSNYVLLTQSELDARISEAMPKRARRARP